MIRPNPRSLKWLLVSRIVALQAAMIAAFVVLIVGALWITGYLVDDYEGGSLDVIADAVVRDSSGGLALEPTSALVRLRSEAPGLWFVIRDAEAHRLSEGNIPVSHRFS